jgi:predicted MPP superfamily phosphohydrolase
MSPLRVVLFLTIGGALLFGVHYYFWARLVRDPVLPAPWNVIATWTLAALGVLVLTGAFVSRLAPRAVSSPLLWVAYTWLGVMFFLLVLLGVSDLGHLVAGIGRRIASADAIDPDRRRLLARIVGSSVGVAALGLATTGFVNVMRGVAVKKVRIPLARLAETASGFKIVQLSDVHVGPTIGREFIADLVARVNALEPDLVAITGDLVDGSVSELGELVRPLADLRAKHGVFFVTGNHEYYSGAPQWVAHLESLGVRVLRNERVAIGGDEGFDLAGIDDWSAHQFGHGHGADLPRALEGRDPNRALVLLAHQPRAIVEAATLGVGLQLSGHTHGGQMFPWNFFVRLQQPYVAGLYDHGGAKIYVSSGTGYWGPPMRVGAPAEITHVELVSA